MNDVTGLDEDGFLKACAGMVGVLRERADEGERLRRLPQVTIDEVTEAGLFAVITPTSLGGHGLLEALGPTLSGLADEKPCSPSPARSRTRPPTPTPTR